MGTVYMMIKRLQAVLAAQNEFDGALIVSPENRFYLTGFSSSNGYLLLNREKAIFITDGRYIEAAQAKIKDCEVRLQTASRKQLGDCFAELGVKRAALEFDRVTVSQLTRYREAVAPAEIYPGGLLDDMLCACRSVKLPFEVERIKKAQRIAEDAFSYICTVIRPGKTEREVALALDYYMLSHGAEALSFETIAVSGAKSSMPHGVPDGKVIESGDFVTLDFGAVVDGYHSDMTRTVAVGAVTQRQREVYETVLQAQTATLKVLRAGISCEAADAAARDVITQKGYGAYFNHSTGHGVGVEIHEYPRLAERLTDSLVAGNVVTVEPGIYLPGEFGVRIEDMAYITQNGCENLTNSPKDLIIL